GGKCNDGAATAWTILLFFGTICCGFHKSPAAPMGAPVKSLDAPTAPVSPVYRTLADSGHSPDRLRSLATRTLRVSSDPSQDRLDRGEAWIFRLAHYGEQLEPAFIIRPLHEVANSAGGKIGHGHRRCRGAS